jgi:hypothetical protein
MIDESATVVASVPGTAWVGAAGLADWLRLSDVMVASIGIAGLGAGLWLTGGAKARARHRPMVLRRESTQVRIPFASGAGPRVRA